MQILTSVMDKDFVVPAAQRKVSVQRDCLKLGGAPYLAQIPIN